MNPLNASFMPLVEEHDGEYPYGSEHPGAVNFTFADGHVASLSPLIDFKLYQALSTCAGNEPVQADGG